MSLALVYVAQAMRSVTSYPGLVRIFTSESMANFSALPHHRSLTLGCEIPRASAAAYCVSFFSINALFAAIISCERSLRFAASSASKPRSANTLPLDFVVMSGGYGFPDCIGTQCCHFQKAQCRAGRFAPALFPALQCAWADSQHGGEC